MPAHSGRQGRVGCIADGVSGYAGRLRDLADVQEHRYNAHEPNLS